MVNFVKGFGDQAELQKAQAEVSYVETEYQNTKQLSEKNVVSPNELALAKAKLDKAKAKQMLIEIGREDTEIGELARNSLLEEFNIDCAKTPNQCK